MKIILLGGGQITLVDDEDYDALNKYEWFFDGSYATRRIVEDGKYVKIYMHRVILKTPKDKLTAHLNQDKLDNRKENLRVCDKSQNTANKPKLSNSTNKYKGIKKQQLANSWMARITVNGTTLHLGTYKTPELAAQAYNNAAMEYFGEFAYLNNIKSFVKQMQ